MINGPRRSPLAVSTHPPKILERFEPVIPDQVRWNKVDQEVHRETWQDDLERKDELISIFLSQLKAADVREEYLETHIRLLDLTIANIHDQLAEKEAEMVRLSMLLDTQAKKKRP